MNAPTIIIGGIILVVLVAIIVRGIHNRKNGKGGCSCGGGCGNCPSSGMCHPKK